MLTNYNFHNIQIRTSVIASVLGLFLASCVPLPISTEPSDVGVNSDTLGPKQESLMRAIRVAPYYQPEQLVDFLNAIREVSDRIEVVSSGEFWQIALPDRQFTSSASVAELLADEARQRSLSAGIRYFVLISTLRTAENTKDFAAYPSFSGEVASNFHFMLVDLEQAGAAQTLVASASGKKTGAWIGFYFLFPYTNPRTEQAALKAAAVRLADTLVSKTVAKPVRIVLLADKDEYLQPGSEAQQLLSRAEGGNPEAQYDLYLTYRINDLPWAQVWLCRAADLGYPKARYRLGLMFEKGLEGMLPDVARAYVWYSLAVKSEAHGSSEKLHSLVSTHSNSSEIRRGQSLLREWQPGQCNASLRINATPRE